MTRPYAYLDLTRQELDALDNLAEKIGHPNRTELMTALARQLIYGETYRTEPGRHPLTACAPALAQLIRTSEKLARLELAFMQMTEETIFPVIAVNGPTITFHSLRDHLRQNMYDRTGLVPDDEQMQTWLKKFYTLNLAKIIEYRLEIQTERHLEQRANENCGENA